MGRCLRLLLSEIMTVLMEECCTRTDIGAEQVERNGPKVRCKGSGDVVVGRWPFLSAFG